MARFLRFAYACLFLCSAAVLHAQPQAFAGANANPVEIILGNAAAPLYGPWKFSVGDSPIDPKTGKPLWAETDFDDSTWETVDLTPKKGAVNPAFGTAGYVPGWTARGHAGYWGYAWYRIRVLPHAQSGQPLALAGPAESDDGYQAFADGQLLGSFGDFTGNRPVVYGSQPAMFRLEPRQEPSATRVIAFRFWMEPGTLVINDDSGGMHRAPVLGEASVVTLGYQAKWLEQIRALLPDVITALVFALLAGMAFSLIFFDRSDPTYLWIGLLFLSTAATAAVEAIAYLTKMLSVTPYLLMEVIFPALSAALWVIVWWTWFGRQGFRWLPRVTAAMTAALMVSSILGTEIFFGVVSHPVAIRFDALNRWLGCAFFGLLVWVVVDAIRRHRLDGWLALPVVILRGVTSFNHLFGSNNALVWFPLGMAVTLGRITSLLTAVVIALLLLRRLLHSVKRQKQMALDVRQAQEVQEVILPQRRVVLPGFEIESEYRPALEVGGDFFQIIPNALDGSVLIVAGDVSGKGLRAGMLVALLIGAIRSTAEKDSDPACVLEALNRRLLGRGDARATCLAMRINRDGAVTLANAGHLPPYLNETQVEIEGSLPLGLIEAFSPSVLNFHLSPGDRLLLVSDGVAEATNKQGHLFGFDRVLELVRTQPSAAKIAETAQAFGQEDDISVISVARSPVAEPALA